METLSLSVPKMYGDHHVLAVRNLMLALGGVQDVYASSSFHLVEVQYDSTKVTPQQIESTLEEAGYLGDLLTPTETGTPATEKKDGQPAFFRHTAAYAQTGRTISFSQTLPSMGRPLWPCPGMGPVKTVSSER
ncbi:MAG: heavy-metal-associated domain-containing protein [Anaerolinea sp.]|nr:heavy-metal-associated domain-containing protein [Anaerolinea sp.]